MVGARFNPVLKDFLVTAIPSLWLIDPEGKIIARDLSVEAMREKLGELMGS